MLAAERGAAANTLLAYRRDLESAAEAIGDLVSADRDAFASLGGAWAGLAPSSLARKCSALRQFCGVSGEDAAKNAVLQFAPMSCGGAKLVSNKMIDESIAKRNRVLLSCNTSHYVGDLSPRAIEADPFHVVVRIHLVFVYEPSDKALHRAM